ncbi:ABC transporter substrate-binding protein [Specibacter cremeus]|uniref:ABC transporter substrate-binding protein n=1 Tax=Specibacter cremeus TaxID=1629051 RepID=UPI000F772F76|nr:ABC transporter substrate-binding protein [Specibacter cremeus]
MNRSRTRSRALVAMAGVLALAVLTGCNTGGPGKGFAGSTALTIMTPAAKSNVDKVTWNVFEGEPQTVDPFKSADYTPNMINSNMCENLLTQTPEFQIKPNLASSYTNPDPLHWVYNLRSDVTFWDGTPMTADDVAWSLNHNLTDKTTFYNYLYTNVAKVAVTGAHQVTVTLSRPDYLFNQELASYAGVVVQKKFYTEHAATVGAPSVGVMCTGPFKFGKWIQGQSITLTRNDHYWNKDLQPKVGTLVFTFLTDDSSITSGLLAGQIDGTFNVPTPSLVQLKNSPVGNMYMGPAPINLTMVYANPAGPMSNPDMRKALQLAVDWNGLGKQTFSGTATPIKLQTPKTVFGFADKDLAALEDSLPAPASAQDEEAKKYVAKVPANIRSQKIVMVVTDVPETQQLGLAIKDAANRIGLNFELKVVPSTGYSNYLYDPKTRAGVDILYTQFWPNIPDPLDWLATTAVSGGLFNQYGYSGVDDLFAKARGTADPVERAKLTAQIEAKLHDGLLPMVPGLLVDNTVWMNKRITGAPASFSYVYYPWAAYLGGTQ